MALEGIGALGELALYGLELLGHALRGLGKFVSSLLRTLGRRGIIDEAATRRGIEAALGFGLLVVVASIASLAIRFWWSGIEPRRIKRATVIVETKADEFAQAVKADDEFELPDAIEGRDPWGNAMRIQADVVLTHRTITITSAGPDEQFGTADDIGKRTRVMREVPQALFDKAKRALLEADAP